jgi:hypothetical protein
MSAQRKRGRPKSAETIEKQRIEAMLNSPSRFKLTAQQHEELEVEYQKSEEIRKHIINAYNGGNPSIPNEHAYEMDSLGDESMEGYEHLVLARDAEYKRIALVGQKLGAEKNKNNSYNQAVKLCKKNKDLILRIKPNGNLSVSRVAELIFENWSERGTGTTFSTKTVGGKPSTKTIIRYINKILHKS